MTEVVRISVGLVFCLAGWAKLRMGQALLSRTIESYEVVGYRLSKPIARVLPSVEIAVGILLLTGIAHEYALSLSLWLLLAFSFALLLPLWRQLDIQCGCFGATRQSQVQSSLIYRNLVLAGMIWWIISVAPAAHAVPIMFITLLLSAIVWPILLVATVIHTVRSQSISASSSL